MQTSVIFTFTVIIPLICKFLQYLTPVLSKRPPPKLVVFIYLNSMGNRVIEKNKFKPFDKTLSWARVPKINKKLKFQKLQKIA